MLDHIRTEDVLFLDIETVPQYAGYDDAPEIYKTLWDKKARNLREKTEEMSPEEIFRRAGIYAEFGKIICISVGYIRIIDNEKTLRLKSFYGHDEKIVLE
jgi:3'-5' exonuclease